MEAGKLRFRATYQTPVRIDDGDYNESTITFRDVADYNVSISPAKAYELVKYKAVQMNVTHQICMRYTPVIQSDGRFIYNGRTFDISSVINVDELNIELNILCNEVVKPSVVQ